MSIDLSCPADLFFGRENVFAKFSLYFTIQSQDESYRSVTIQHVEVGYFRADNDIVKFLKGSNRHELKIKWEGLKDGSIDIEIPQPGIYETNYSSNIRIVVLLNSYPSNMKILASLVSLPTTEGNSRTRRTFDSVTYPHPAPSPNETRLQSLLCWIGAFGHESLFAAYLEQNPSVLYMEDDFGMTPFSCAAFAGETSVIRRILQQCGATSAREKPSHIRGLSPLEAAALRDDEKFISFLSLLRYFEGLKDNIPELDKIPPPDGLPALEKSDIKHELDTAVSKDQTTIIEKLIRLQLTYETEKEDWLAQQIVQAADAGALSLVRGLKSCGAKIDVVVDGKVDRTTPLMSAIHNNRTKVAEFLIMHGAGNEDVLRMAVQNKQHSIIRALLQAGIQVKGDFKMELLSIATTQRDSTTLMLLELEKGTGKLATSADLHPAVDEHFEATVVTFLEKETPDFEELSVAKLMEKPNDFFSLNNRVMTNEAMKDKTIKFTWFHLPANNVSGAFIWSPLFS